MCQMLKTKSRCFAQNVDLKIFVKTCFGFFLLSLFLVHVEGAVAADCVISGKKSSERIQELKKELKNNALCKGEAPAPNGQECKKGGGLEEALNANSAGIANERFCIGKLLEIEKAGVKTAEEFKTEAKTKRTPTDNSARPPTKGAEEDARKCEEAARDIDKGDFKRELDSLISKRRKALRALVAQANSLRKQCGLKGSINEDGSPGDKGNPGDKGKDKGGAGDPGGMGNDEGGPAGGEGDKGDQKKDGGGGGGDSPGGQDKKGDEKKEGGGGGGSPGGGSGGGDQPKKSDEPPKQSDVTKKGEDPPAQVAGCAHEEKMLNDANQYLAGFQDRYNQESFKDRSCLPGSICSIAQNSLEKEKLQVRAAQSALDQCRDRQKGPSNGRGSESAK